MKTKLRQSPQISVLVILLLCITRVALSATYYMANDGLDENDGLSPRTAWATLDRVSKAPLQPGDIVLFRRHDVWRGQLKAHSGSPAGNVTYSAYGEGEKPLLLGSISRSAPADWTDEGRDIWSTGDLAMDVGNIIFGHEEACGFKKWREEDLVHDNDFYYDKPSHKVKVLSKINPASRYGRIECAMDQFGINENGQHYVTYENLTVKYAGAHGIGGGNTHHITVRHCDFGFIGGGEMTLHDKPVRYGNGIEFWMGAHDNLVENCRLWEIYDAALTDQSTGPKTTQYNIVYRNNVMWNCEYSFEYWNRPTNSESHAIYFTNNTCLNAGHSWGHFQRPDRNGRHLSFWRSTAPAHDVIIRDNIFCEATENAFYAPEWSRAQIDALFLDHNCWYQPAGQMILLKGKSYTMAQFASYQADWNKEPHSVCARPEFVDAAHQDFRLAPNSPFQGMGSTTQ